MLKLNTVLLVDSVLDWLATRVNESPVPEEAESGSMAVTEVDPVITEANNIPVASTGP